MVRSSLQYRLTRDSKAQRADRDNGKKAFGSFSRFCTPMTSNRFNFTSKHLIVHRKTPLVHSNDPRSLFLNFDFRPSRHEHFKRTKLVLDWLSVLKIITVALFVGMRY